MTAKAKPGHQDQNGPAAAVRNGDLMPHDRVLEICALGAILDAPSEGEVYEAVATVLAETDLYFHEHRVIYQMMRTIAARGDTPDGPTVYGELQTRGLLEEAGGPSYISRTLMNYVGSPALAAQYGRRVHELAERRRDIELAGMLAQVAYTGDTASLQAVRRNIAETLTGEEEAADDAPDLSLYLTDEEAANLPPARGILGDILYEDSIAYLFAPTGRWKTFVAVSFSMCIATGTPWLGRPVVEGDVLYVCAEGARGIGQRVAAWKRHHHVSGKTRIIIRKASLDIDIDKQVSALIRDLELLGIRPALIVFDTLATCTDGHENESETAKAVTKSARKMIRHFGGEACVLIVHHSGYDLSHMRGSSEFESDSDTTLLIEGGEPHKDIEVGEPITLVCDKPFKDGEKFKPITLTTQVETWALEQSGEIRRSLVIVPGDAAVAAQQEQIARKLSKKQQATLDALDSRPDGSASYGEWWRAAKMYGVTAKTTFDDCRGWLMRNHYVTEDNHAGKYVSLVRNPHRTSTAVPLRTSTVSTEVSIDTVLTVLDRRRSAAPEEG